MKTRAGATRTTAIVSAEERRRAKVRKYNREYQQKRRAMNPKNRKGPKPKSETIARKNEGAPNSHAARQRNYRVCYWLLAGS